MIRRAAWTLLACGAWGAAASADVWLPPLFSDGMVLQRGTAAPVWGAADSGEAVTVRLQDRTASATAGRDGAWRVRLDDLKAGGPWTLTVSGRNTLEVRNVLVGEVWVCGGQSNMYWPVSRCADARAEIAAARFPSIRLFTVPRSETETPVQVAPGRWRECDPDSVASFSAVAYYFGRDLQKALDVPVGLIHASVGGTPAEAWTNEDTLKTNADFKEILDGYPKAMERFTKAQAEQAAAAEKARVEGKPFAPSGPGKPWMPAGLYNGMIAPLQPYAIRGAIWYQGEGNAPRAHQYRSLFPAMIRCWRKAWGQGDFPFLFVQLAAWGPAGLEPEEGTWPELREAQLLTLSAAPNTAMAVSIDVGDEQDIHPKRKQPVGARLALAARALAYGENIVYSGPIYESMKVEGDKAVLTFTHASGGLVAADPPGGDTVVIDGGKAVGSVTPEERRDTDRDRELKGFVVAGEDRVLHEAQAKIQGDRVEVRSPDVKKPVAVRYGWGRYPACTLCNKEGLPASPFRTDDWPGVTRSKP